MKVLLFVGLLAATALASHHSSDPSKDGEHFKVICSFTHNLLQISVLLFLGKGT